MINVKCFTFNAFQENTYIVYQEGSENCIIIDPGCSTQEEDSTIERFIEANKLVPRRLINTHCHIDHVLGNAFISKRYGLKLEAHINEKPLLESCDTIGKMYGIPFRGSPGISVYLNEGENIVLDNLEFEILLTPGHSPGSLSLYSSSDKILISGDVLFYSSIGRTDLPGGNYQTLIDSIKTQLMVLPEDVNVYPGHGPVTTIGFEKNNNPFLKD